MEFFSNTAVIWFLLGFLLFILEFASPGFILFFFGLGAWMVAGITVYIDIPLNFQIILFLVTSLMAVAVFRKWAREKLGMLNAPKSVLEDEIIGKTAKAETAIMPGNKGKVSFRGTLWGASSSEVINPGDQVIIIANESINLIVKPIN